MDRPHPIRLRAGPRPPDQRAVSQAHLFDLVACLGFDGSLAAEDKPVGPTDVTPDWMTA